MIRWLQILTIATVVLTPSVLSYERNLDYTTLDPHKPKPKVNTPKGEVEVKQEHVDELNEMISQYLLTLEFKKREITDENSLKILETMKLLIAQSWIRTLKPDPDLVTLEGIGLGTLTNSIQDKLIQDNIKFPVVDAIITYTKEIEPMFTEAFERNRKHLEKADEIFKKHIKKATEARNEIDAAHLKSSWKGVFYTLNQINGDLVAHRMAHRMYIQSYMLNFASENERSMEKLTLISTDKKKSKKFRVPSMYGMDIFSDILLGDPEEMDKIILIGRISRYLEFFEEERKTRSDTNLNRAMDLVKDLIVQGWIEKLNPPSQFLLQEYSNKNKDDIKQALLRSYRTYEVNDAILLYTKEKEQEIEGGLKTKQASLKEKYDRLQAQIIDVPTYRQTEDMNKIENEMNKLQDHLVAHRIAKLFYLHSYQENFVSEKSETLEIKSSTGRETKQFKVTPIDLMRFYENPMFD